MLASMYQNITTFQSLIVPTFWLVFFGLFFLGLLGLSLWLLLQRGRSGQTDRQRLDLLSRMGQSVTGSLRLQKVLQQILDRIPLLIGAEGVAILLLDDDELEFVAISGSAAAGLEGYRMPADAGIAGKVVQERRPVSVTGQSGRTQIYQQAEQVSGYETQTLLAVPLLVGEELVGILEAVHSHKNGFSVDDLQTLEDAANWAAIAIQNARLYEQVMAELQERQRVELSLRESEHRYRTLAEVSPIGIFRLDSAGNYLYTNGRWSEITQVAPALALGKNWLTSMSLKRKEMVREAWKTAVNQTLFTDQARFQYEFELLAHGSEKWVMVTVAPEYNEKGEHIGYIGTLADISQQKQAEAVLRYGSKMESLDLFAGAIAHDYNNLLMAMMGQAAIAQYQLGSENPANAHIDKLTQTAERAAALTRQVLTYSGGQYFEATPTSLNELVKENEDALKAIVPEDVRLTFELAAELPLVQTDSAQIQQLLSSLVKNGVEAVAERKEGQIVIQTERAYVSADDIHLWQYTNTPLTPGLYCVLVVQDNGEGIVGENLSKIFDPFFTTKPSRKGLGLSTVLGLVRGHDGGLAVKSEFGVGSRFELYFPAQQ
ncbi:MAG: GAF domain-containing protein [Chloroflexota bacterium]